MKDLDSLPYRPCVGVMLINRAGRVFIGRRAGKMDERISGFVWQMPQGGVDEGEDLFAAAKRELYEETNVTSVALLAEMPGWLNYDFPREVVETIRHGRYRGQAQKWFALRFLGADSEIDVHHPAGGAHHAEFDAWRWVEMAELLGLIVPFKRAVYEKVVAAFAGLVG